METTQSTEDYLETILILSQSLPVVRSVDVANEIGYSKSSVSVAMKKLRENDEITETSEGYIYLTDTGKKIAEKIYERHRWFSTWLEGLGVPTRIATNDACKIEHVISAESFAAIKEHVTNLKQE